MKTTKASSGWKIFLVGFGIMIVLLVASTFKEKKGKVLKVRDNKGMAQMSTVDGFLVAVFQNGLVSVWDWSDLSKPAHQFKVPSDRAVFFDGSRLGVIAKSNSALFTIYDFRTSHKQKDIRIGSAADEIWPAVSPDRKTILIVRKIAAFDEGRFGYEFMTLNHDDELLSVPTVVSVSEPDQSIVDFAVTNSGIMLAAGKKDGKGRLLAVDLDMGSVLWDRAYEATQEFCSLVLSPDNSAFYAGNRNGKLYKINSENGDIIKEITLLREGETRKVTNDVSVLNLSTDSKGQYVAATITPVSYILSAETDQVLRRVSAHKLSSKITFSPNNRYVATSDIRAGYPIDIWELEK